MQPFIACLSILVSTHSGVKPNQGYYMQPTIRGDEVVFVSQGELWKVGVGGGTAVALTSHVAPSSFPALSPDGTTVAFTGTYEGPSEVYTMPVGGGPPKRLTYEGTMQVQGWTPDGKVLAATRYAATLPGYQLVTIDPDSRRKALLPLAQGAEGSFDPDTKTVFFTRFSFQGSQTRRYVGGTAQNIWRYTDGTPEAIPMTQSYPGTSKNPMVWNHEVFFLTDRDGTMNVWSMDERGGSLKQITHSNGWEIQSASIDQGRIAYQAGADIHILDLTQGTDKLLDITMSSDFNQLREEWIKNPTSYITAAKPSPDGSKAVITARGQVFVAPVEQGRFVEASRKQGVRYREAMFAPDGKSILVLSDQTGETEWWRLPANGVGPAEQLTTGSQVLGISGEVSPDGKLLAYSDKDWNLWIWDLVAKKKTKVIACLDGALSDLHWSPDCQWLAYTFPTMTFQKVMVYSTKTGKSVPVTSDRSDAYSAVWSPDGKWLYFLSDRTFRSSVPSPWGARQPEPYFDKQTNIYQLGLTKGLRSPFQAPDELYTPPKGPPKKATTPVPEVIDFDGILDRQVQAPVPSGNYGNLTTNGDRLFAMNANSTGSSELVAVDVKPLDVKLITLQSGISDYSLSADGKKLMYRKGGAMAVMAASGGDSKPVVLGGWTFPMDPEEEWRQMFHEAWRLERDYFWNTKMSGVDWNAVYEKYLPLVDRVRDRTELSNLLAQMIAQLSALHMFVYGGDAWHSPDSVAPGSLGAVLTRDPTGGGYRVGRIYQGDPDYPNSLAPLAKPSVDVHVGDVVVAVNGVDALSAPDINALLRNQTGKQVLLHVKSGKSQEARDCIVEPISPGALADLKYTDWELSRRKAVEQQSNGQIGYLHLRAMGTGDIGTFERDFYPNFAKQGLIIDVRHNNGGNIDSWVLEKLMRKAWGYMQGRVGNPNWNMQEAFRGYLVVLCDESTASDGETFSLGTQRLGLGKVIGTRTWGGGIWLTSSNVLEDNGIATAAEFGVYGPNGQWYIEQHGVDPDMVVDNLPHATYLGHDAQLQAGIDYLQKLIREHPVPIPPTPKYPDWSYPRKQNKGAGN